MKNNFALSLSPGTAIYSQLASVLRGRIARGEWPEGSAIPTLDELSEEYGVARVSVRQAVLLLVSEGLLSSRRGRRTTVIKTGLYERTLSTGVTAPLEQVSQFSSRIIATTEESELPSFAKGLGKAAQSYIKVRKIDHDAGEPYAVSDIFVAKTVYNRIPKRALTKFKVSRLVREALSVPLISAREKIMIASATPDEAASLDCPLAAPVAVVHRIYVNANSQIVYAGWSVYRGDRFFVERELLELVHGDVANIGEQPDVQVCAETEKKVARASLKAKSAE